MNIIYFIDIFIIFFIVWLPFAQKKKNYNQFQQWFSLHQNISFGESCVGSGRKSYLTIIILETAKSICSGRSSSFAWTLKLKFDRSPDDCSMRCISISSGSNRSIRLWHRLDAACTSRNIRFVSWFLATANLFIFSMLSFRSKFHSNVHFLCFSSPRLTILHNNMLNNKQRINKISKQENWTAILYKFLPRC